MTQLNFKKNDWSRVGTGLLPPNKKQWGYEHKGLNLRDALEIAPTDFLDHKDAFGLLTNVQVLPHSDIPMSQKYIDYFKNEGLKKWSGIGIPIDNGQYLVLYNDNHSLQRCRATLMEEFYHLCLKHTACSVSRTLIDGKHRQYNKLIEDEAYCSGAAALLPYKGLKTLLESGMTVPRIANHFNVTHDLVTFRTKVTKLYNKYVKNK